MAWGAIAQIAGQAAGQGMGMGLEYVGKNVEKGWAHTSARHQRKWEEYMSSTAYQRAVKDMEAAGINPILAVTRGFSGASTPGGAMAATPRIDSDFDLDVPGALEKGLSNVKQMKVMRDQLATIEAARRKAEAEADVTEKTLEARIVQEIRESVARQLELEQQARTSASQSQRNVEEAGLMATRNRAEKMAIPYSAEQEAAVRKTPIGELGRAVKRGGREAAEGAKHIWQDIMEWRERVRSRRRADEGRK
jgi:hypothetical protein